VRGKAYEERRTRDGVRGKGYEGRRTRESVRGWLFFGNRKFWNYMVLMYRYYEGRRTWVAFL
jgi:hypothetical protein